MLTGLDKLFHPFVVQDVQLAKSIINLWAPQSLTSCSADVRIE